MRSAFLWLATMVWAACESQERLVSEPELARLEADVMAKVRANVKRSCPRPVLRGQPTAGRADSDIVALLEPEGPLVSCLDSFADDSRRPSAWSCERALEEAPCESAPLDDPAAVPEGVLDIERRCESLEEAIARAVAHEDACSPYLTGRRRTAKLVTLLRMGYAATVRARALARQGRVAASIRLILDVLRLQQDVMRGEAAIFFAMLGSASARVPLGLAGEILRVRSDLSAEELDAFARETDLLLRTESHFSEHLRGEHVDTSVVMMLPQIKPPGWTPPGGWSEGQAPRDGVPAGETVGADARDDAAIAWVALGEKTREALRVCPAGSSAMACIDALARQERQWRERAARKLPPSLGDPERGPVSRRHVLDVIAGIAPNDARYARMWARRLVALAALRLHLEARRIAARTGSCPAPSDYERDPLLALRGPGVLGYRLAIEAEGSVVHVRTPLWLLREGIQPYDLWTIRCPAAPLPRSSRPVTVDIADGPRRA